MIQAADICLFYMRNQKHYEYNNPDNDPFCPLGKLREVAVEFPGHRKQGKKKQDARETFAQYPQCTKPACQLHLLPAILTFHGFTHIYAPEKAPRSVIDLRPISVRASRLRLLHRSS
ncbi:MAG: hypothetical protein FWF10_00175 [Clostridiales bacterium]|nr:hypothetical protein [Clostridiales bacterium]